MRSDHFTPSHRAQDIVPWRQIIGTRNRVVHGYFEVDLDILWDVAIIDVLALANQVRLIQSGLNADPEE